MSKMKIVVAVVGAVLAFGSAAAASVSIAETASAQTGGNAGSFPWA